MAETVAQKMKKVAEASQRAASTSSEKLNLDSSTETATVTGTEVEVEVAEGEEIAEENQPILLTDEQIELQESALTDAIAKGMEWFEFGRDEEQYNSMTEKEQIFTRLLDPMIWLMREAEITYKERKDGCEECKVRVEGNGNSLAVAVAEMILGRM